MSHNTFGHLFRVTTFGESHGPRSAASSTAVRRASRWKRPTSSTYLDRRRPGQSRFTTQRQEPDAVKILSGVFTDDATARR